MSKEPIYKKISRKLQYNNMSNWNPLKPVAIWANTNNMLDDFYSRPEINIINDLPGLKKKNTMRHMVGLGISGREYNPWFARGLGAVKETGDFFTHKNILENLIDSKQDYINNERGIRFTENNPFTSDEDLMNYAYDMANKNLGGLGTQHYANVDTKPLTLKMGISKTDYIQPSLYDLLLNSTNGER